MADEIDHEYTNEVVCPYCGYKHRDSWEFNDGNHECGSCERTFLMTRDVSVTYSTEKIEALEAASEATDDSV